MGKIKELIKSFINPAPEEQTFRELALESGISENELNELNKTMNGIDWGKFAREDEETRDTKSGRATKKARVSLNNRSLEQPNSENSLVSERKTGEERE